jgi:phosphatidylglycerol lysyltransferase
VSLVLFAAALVVLRRELHAVTWPALAADIGAVLPSRLLLALLLTALDYLAMAGHDVLAFAYIGKAVSRLRVAVASFIAYAIANNVGFASLSGASVRYRFFTRWGVSAEELSRIILFDGAGFWGGLLILGGAALVLSPLPGARDLPAAAWARPAGFLLLLMAAAYLATLLLRRRTFRLWTLEVPMPAPRLGVAQVALSVFEWTLAALVLYVLLPPSPLPLWGFMGAFLSAQLLGLASHVPGGLGVFESLMVLMLRPYLGAATLLPALVAYRLVYYLAPFAAAVLALVVDEMRQRREHVAWLGSALGRLAEQLTPRVLSAFTFLGGVVLLFSGATPAAPGRLELLDRFLPLGVLEASHFLGSVAGVTLLLVSQGLSRRLDAAYHLAVGAIVVGMGASLLKGADYEEALVLGLLLIVVARARPAFDRKAALYETQFSAEWLVAVVAALGASVWLGLFAFGHVQYTNELWWQFELNQEAARFLRSSVGAALALLLFGVARLIRPAPHAALAPSDQDLEAAATAIAAQTSTLPSLAYLRDKALLFDDDRRGFVMYGVQGRTWVALGDPVGPRDRRSDLVRLFLERCDDFAGVPVFYEIGKDNLHHYADFGLTFVKLGEEAQVDLAAFTLQGSHAGKFRQALRRVEKEQAAFRIAPVEEVPALLDQLQAVSDDWLRDKAGAEKGFSLGFFDRDYVARFPVAVLEREGRVLAFANLWPGPQNVELSIDLMRYHRDAPASAMEALLVHVMLWGKERGYRFFALGMAPLSGFESSPVAPLWNRLGGLLYRRGGAFYNFQGLRAYKEKFNPVWEPRYLAYPGGLHLPVVMADVAALVAGGYRRIFLNGGPRRPLRLPTPTPLAGTADTSESPDLETLSTA